MTIDKINLKKFTIAFEREIKSLEDTFGIKIELGPISYNASGFHTRMEAKNLDDNGKVVINPHNEFRAVHAFSTQLDENLALTKQVGVIGHQFGLTNGEIITVTDFDPRKPKFSVLYSKNGKNYACPVKMILRRIA